MNSIPNWTNKSYHTVLLICIYLCCTHTPLQTDVYTSQDSSVVSAELSTGYTSTNYNKSTVYDDSTVSTIYNYQSNNRVDGGLSTETKDVLAKEMMKQKLLVLDSNNETRLWLLSRHHAQTITQWKNERGSRRITLELHRIKQNSFIVIKYSFNLSSLVQCVLLWGTMSFHCC